MQYFELRVGIVRDRMGTILFVHAFNLWSCNANKVHLACCFIRSFILLLSFAFFVVFAINMGKLVWCLFILFSPSFYNIYKVVNWNTESADSLLIS